MGDRIPQPERPADGSSAPPPLPPPWPARPIPWIPAVLAAVLLFVAGAFFRAWLGSGVGTGPAPQSQGLARLTIVLSPGAPLATDTHAPALALSPRGDRLIYVARRRSETVLYDRPLDQLEPSMIPGTEGASAPFFSPDGDWVGFFAGGVLKKVPLKGGDPVTICPASRAPGGASWGPEGMIDFIPSFGGGLYQVAASGGAPKQLAPPSPSSRSQAILWPEVLPGGRAVLITLTPAGSEDAARIATLSLTSGEWSALGDVGGFARYAPTGHLIFVRGGALLAAPFDRARLRLTGRPVPILEGVLEDRSSGSAHIALAANGTLVYAPSESASAERELLWVSARGEATPITTDRRDFDMPRLSPDGRRLAVSVSEGRRLSLWIYDIPDGTAKRIASEGSDGLPVWSPDGRWLTFISPRAGAWNIFREPSEGGAPQLLASSEHPLSPSSWSPDGRTLAYTEADPETKGDIWILTPGGDRRPRPLVRTGADEWGAVFSPDGRHVAYTSNESGRNEVYLIPYPPRPGERRAISSDGGYGPIWGRGGAAIYYRAGDRVMEVPIVGRPEPAPGRPRVLFRGRYEEASAGSPNFDAAPDGSRFVMIRRGERDAGPMQVNVVLGWLEEMRRRVSAAEE